MQDIILHHFAVSPFAEKVRCILGFKRLEWKSVDIPLIMPKPDLTALTGGYRRTPVLQIGADIYCDTSLIVELLERIAPQPSLFPAPVAGLARILAQWADSSLFSAAMGYAFQPAAIPDLLGNAAQAKAFVADRAAMRGSLPHMPVAEAGASLAEYLRRLEDMLADGSPYLLGEQPTVADFSIYHPLWCVRRARAVAGILEATPAVLAWMDRMADAGRSGCAEMTSEQALAIARAAPPVARGRQPFIDHGASLGDRVTIAATDYGCDPVEGELVLSTATELALRRTDARAGSVVVHFPRLGFRLKKEDDLLQEAVRQTHRNV